MMPSCSYVQVPATLLASALAGPSLADSLACELQKECRANNVCDETIVDLTFEIDRLQFIDPQDRSEPPRRKLSQVSMADRQFPAEPFLMGDVRGFWAEGLAGSHSIFIVNADGTAKFSNSEMGEHLIGTCEDLE